MYNPDPAASIDTGRRRDISCEHALTGRLRNIADILAAIPEIPWVIELLEDVKFVKYGVVENTSTCWQKHQNHTTYCKKKSTNT